MKKILLLTLFTVITLISCSQDDETSKTDEDYLEGTWTIKKTITYNYLNGELEAIKESILEEPYPKLTFTPNNEVTYSNPDYENLITGNWNLDEKNLKTDLKINPGSSSGYGSIYFFSENIITLISETNLILKSPMSQERTSSNGDKLKDYTETFLEK